MHRPTRGLAASAVAALAVAGLAVPLSAPASADPVDGIRLLNPFNPGKDVSSRPLPFAEGEVYLTAELQDADAPRSFAYNPDPDADDADGGWVDITGDSFGSAGPYAAVAWQVPPELDGTSIALRASTVDGTGNVETSVINGVRVAPAYEPGDVDAQDKVFTLPFTGVFTQPYADSNRTASLLAVLGLTTATEGTVEISGWDPQAGEFAGRTQAQVSCSCDKGGGDEEDFGFFDGVLDIADFGAEVDGATAVAAERDTDAVLPFELAPLTISGIQATAEETRPGLPAEVFVHVSGDSPGGSGIGGGPVAGAEVRRLSDRRVVGYTDGSGSVTTTQLGGTEETYYVNTTDANGFQPDVDFSTGPFTPPTYTQQPTTIEPRLLDGRLFDVDESLPGDVSLLALDQEGAPIVDQTLEYRLLPQVGGDDVPWTEATTGPDGSVPVVLSGDESGRYDLEYRYSDTEDDPDPGAGSVSFRTGDARLRLEPGGAQEAPVGGRVRFVASLTLAGRPLPGRRLDVAYEDVSGGDNTTGVLVEGSPVDRMVSVPTDEDGRAVIRVLDGESSRKPEQGRLTVATGDTAATEDSTLAGNADEEDSAGVRFGEDDARPVRLFRRGSGNGARADQITALGPNRAEGERVRFLKVTRKGKRVEVATAVLDGAGDATVRVPDRNGRLVTTYVVKLVPSPRVETTETNTIRLR